MPWAKIAGLWKQCSFQPNGKILAIYRRQDPKLKAMLVHPQPNGASFQDSSLIVSHQIVLDNEMIGNLCIRTSLEMLYSLFTTVGIITIGIAACALLLSYIFSSRFQRLISKPILDLAQTAREVTVQKSYSLRVARTNQDEIGDLIDGFNEMLEQIQNEMKP